MAKTVYTPAPRPDKHRTFMFDSQLPNTPGRSLSSQLNQALPELQRFVRACRDPRVPIDAQIRLTAEGVVEILLPEKLAWMAPRLREAGYQVVELAADDLRGLVL